jgi:hypothetical protein
MITAHTETLKHSITAVTEMLKHRIKLLLKREKNRNKVATETIFIVCILRCITI